MPRDADVRSIATTPVLDIVRGLDVHPEPIKWLWKDWFAGGKLHLAAGAPGTGKTSLALAFAAAMTSGGRWPDGSPVAAADALIVSYEDDPADTIVPRLSAMGADLSRIHILRSVRDGKEQRAFNVHRDREPLLKAAARIQTLKLVVVDPVVSAIGPVDSHRNLETRQALQPLADFAAASGVAVLGITHLAKGTSGRDPLERLLGSVAFGALARVVLGAAKVRDDNGTERRVVARIKSNIGPDDGGYNYELVPTEVDGIQTVTVLWGSPLDGTARELLAAAEEDEPAGDRSALAEAADFLASILGGGPIGARDVFRQASDAGIAKKTVDRAKRQLGIRPTKTRFDGGWEWRLPAAADDAVAQGGQGAHTPELGYLDHLGHLGNGSCPHGTAEHRINTGLPTLWRHRSESGAAVSVSRENAGHPQNEQRIGSAHHAAALPNWEADREATRRKLKLKVHPRESS